MTAATIQSLISKLRSSYPEDGDIALLETLLKQQQLFDQHPSEDHQSQQSANTVTPKQDTSLFRKILDHIPADIAVMDANNRFVYVNRYAVKDKEIRNWIVGRSMEEYCLHRNKPSSIAAERDQLFYETIASGKRKTWEEEVLTKDGNREVHYRILYPVFDETGAFDMMIVYGFNITDRKLIEEQAKTSEINFNSIFDNNLALICTHTFDGTITNVNDAVVSILGYSKEEVIGKPVSALLPPDKRPSFQSEYMDDILKNGKSDGIMYAIHRNGQRKYLLYHNLIVSENGNEPYIISFSQDITERIMLERDLKKSEEKYRNIIANMNLGLLEVDIDERITYANASFCDMSGYTVDELSGRKAPELFVNNVEKEESDAVNVRRIRGESDAYERIIVSRNGDTRWWLISGAPTFDEKGKVKGSIGIHLDITEQKKLEQELRRAKAETEQNARTKELFLANISHEIRTPMNAIAGITRLLQRTPLDGQQKIYLDTIQNASANLLVILNDLLDSSRMESGKFRIENIPFSIHSLIADSVRVQEFKAGEQNTALRYHIAPGVADILLGDPYRINQVLANLISNAVKFTEKGSVDVRCEIVAATPTQQTLKLSVIDTGIGISEEYLKHLFDKFSQEDETIARKFGGTGLGMSISRQLVELMGGTIEASSTKGVGTTISFALVLPIGSRQETKPLIQDTVQAPVFRNTRILLVDDNATNRLLAGTILKQHGATITEATDGDQAIQAMEHQSFDVVLMDVQMPGRNGLDATRHIRRYLDPSTPIIALTAGALKEEEDRCLQAGMNDFISKPFDEEKMVRQIAEWLDRQVSGHAEDKNNSAAEETSFYSLNKLVKMTGGDNNFICEMLELFITEIPASVRQMEEALALSDWKTISSVAHRIKPSLLNLAIHSVIEDIRALEAVIKSDIVDIPDITGRLANVKKVLSLVIDGLQKDLVQYADK